MKKVTFLFCIQNSTTGGKENLCKSFLYIDLRVSLFLVITHTKPKQFQGLIKSFRSMLLGNSILQPMFSCIQPDLNQNCLAVLLYSTLLAVRFLHFDYEMERIKIAME